MVMKNVFKPKYIELLEKYKMELTEMHIKEDIFMISIWKEIKKA